jgi:hypothetical protein
VGPQKAKRAGTGGIGAKFFLNHQIGLRETGDWDGLDRDIKPRETVGDAGNQNGTDNGWFSYKELSCDDTVDYSTGTVTPQYQQTPSSHLRSKNKPYSDERSCPNIS